MMSDFSLKDELSRFWAQVESEPAQSKVRKEDEDAASLSTSPYRKEIEVAPEIFKDGSSHQALRAKPSVRGPATPMQAKRGQERLPGTGLKQGNRRSWSMHRGMKKAKASLCIKSRRARSRSRSGEGGKRGRSKHRRIRVRRRRVRAAPSLTRPGPARFLSPLLRRQPKKARIHVDDEQAETCANGSAAVGAPAWPTDKAKEVEHGFGGPHVANQDEIHAGVGSSACANLDGTDGSMQSSEARTDDKPDSKAATDDKPASKAAPVDWHGLMSSHLTTWSQRAAASQSSHKVDLSGPGETDWTEFLTAAIDQRALRKKEAQKASALQSSQKDGHLAEAHPETSNAITQSTGQPEDPRKSQFGVTEEDVDEDSCSMEPDWGNTDENVNLDDHLAASAPTEGICNVQPGSVCAKDASDPAELVEAADLRSTCEEKAARSEHLGVPASTEDGACSMEPSQLTTSMEVDFEQAEEGQLIEQIPSDNGAESKLGDTSGSQPLTEERIRSVTSAKSAPKKPPPSVSLSQVDAVQARPDEVAGVETQSAQGCVAFASVETTRSSFLPSGGSSSDGETLDLSSSKPEPKAKDGSDIIPSGTNASVTKNATSLPTAKVEEPETESVQEAPSSDAQIPMKAVFGRPVYTKEASFGVCACGNNFEAEAKFCTVCGSQRPAKVKVAHRVKAVSKILSSEDRQVEEEALKFVLAMQDAAEPTEFEIELEKAPGQPLGVEIDWSTWKFLEVTDVQRGGLANSWNDRNPDKAVQVGDRIVEVNGSGRGDSKVLLQTIKEESKLTLSIQRQGAPSPPSAKDKAKDTPPTPPPPRKFKAPPAPPPPRPLAVEEAQLVLHKASAATPAGLQSSAVEAETHVAADQGELLPDTASKKAASSPSADADKDLHSPAEPEADNAETLEAMTKLAAYYARKGEESEALTLRRKIAELSAETLGSLHAHTLAAEVDLAASLRKHGEVIEADRLYAQTMTRLGAAVSKNQEELQNKQASDNAAAFCHGDWDQVAEVAGIPPPPPPVVAGLNGTRDRTRGRIPFQRVVASARDEDKKQREVYVGNLPKDNRTNHDSVRDAFSVLFNALPGYHALYGATPPVRDVTFPRHSNPCNGTVFCFVAFFDDVCASTAIAMNGFTLFGQVLKITRTHSYKTPVQGDTPPLDVSPLRLMGYVPSEEHIVDPTEVFFGNVPIATVTEDMVRDFLMPICVSLPEFKADLGLPFHRVTKIFTKPYCFVKFQSAEMAQAIIMLLHGMEMWGNKLCVERPMLHNGRKKLSQME